jgi:hypothetical protein
MKQNRSNLALGLILLIIGGWLLVSKQVPAIQEWLTDQPEGPIITIGVGLLILLFGLLTNSPGLAVPASIVAGIGGILYYNEVIGDGSSWSYMWTLIPGFVGVGSIIAGLLGENTRRSISGGLRLLVTSAVLFLIFATFFGGLEILDPYGLPILLILLGLYVLARGFQRGGKVNTNETR